MKDILFDNNGYPLLMRSDKIFAVTKNSKSKSANEKIEDKFSLNNTNFVCWGSDNNFPKMANNIINTTGVLSTAIGLKSRIAFGQGIFPMLIDGYDEKGNETLKTYDNEDLRKFLNSYQFRNYMSQGFRDLFKYGNCFPIFYFNEDASKIVQIVIRNARHCRLSENKDKLCIFPNFEEKNPSTTTEATVIDMLDEDNPSLDLEIRKACGKLNGNPIAFPRIKNYFSSNDYYGNPDWESAYRSGWIDIAHKIPQFLSRSYANAMTLMWHLQIPKSFWENKFNSTDYPDLEERKKAIIEFRDNLEQSLCGDENASKALITDYTTGNGRAEEKWSIERLENEIDAKERLTTSAAANSEILFSMMLNPSLLGAGMPGGAYAGNAGSGSDIREAYLVSHATTTIEKKQLLDPLYTALFFNNHPENLVLKYKEIILTTLNTGQSQKDVAI